ncbi:MAG: hypothetical protein ACI8Z1_001235 [Candidatus Azotimanducaceae bacterium]|jgi:hypothetical protein
MVIFILLGVAGCSAPDPLSVSDYKTRLARTLEMQVPELIKPTHHTFPRIRELNGETESSNVNLFEFLSLNDCELQTVVAEKNSSLGKQASLSIQLVSELDFLRLAEICLPLIEKSKQKLAQKLREVMEEKQKQLGYHIWRATLAGPEFRALWQYDVRSRYQSDPALIEALNLLNADIGRWLGGDFSVDSHAIERRLEIVQTGHGGALLFGWQSLAIELDAASFIASQRLTKGAWCADGYRPESAEIFNGVVKRYFIAGVQQKVAVMNRASLELDTTIGAMESQLAFAESPTYRQWRAQRSEIIELGKASMVAHAKALEPLMRPCGFLPTTPLL